MENQLQLDSSKSSGVSRAYHKNLAAVLVVCGTVVIATGSLVLATVFGGGVTNVAAFPSIAGLLWLQLVAGLALAASGSVLAFIQSNRRNSATTDRA